MFPLIISSFLTEEEKNSKKIPVLKLVGLLILAVFLIFPFVIGRIFESKEKNNSGKVIPLISIENVIAAGSIDCDCGCDCGNGLSDCSCDCGTPAGCDCGCSDGGGPEGGGGHTPGGNIGTNVGPGEGNDVMGTEAHTTTTSMPAVGDGMTATTPDGSTVSGQVVSVTPVTGVQGVDAIATIVSMEGGGLVSVAVSISGSDCGCAAPDCAAPGCDCGCGDCACGCITPEETCPPGSTPSPTIPEGCHSVKTIPAP